MAASVHCSVHRHERAVIDDKTVAVALLSDSQVIAVRFVRYDRAGPADMHAVISPGTAADVKMCRVGQNRAVGHDERVAAKGVRPKA